MTSSRFFLSTLNYDARSATYRIYKIFCGLYSCSSTERVQPTCHYNIGPFSKQRISLNTHRAYNAKFEIQNMIIVSPSSIRHTYLLTPRCRVLPEQLTGLQLVKKFKKFHGTRRFITALTSVRHLSLSWASPIQSICPHPTSWRSILILSTQLRLGLPSGLFPSGFPTKTLYTPLSSPIRATCPAHLIHSVCHMK